MIGYWYYQTGEKSPWKHVEGGTQTEAETEIRKQGGIKQSVLRISQLVGDDADIYTDKFDLKYSGPLYFDIDCGETDDLIAQAIESTKQLVRSLLAVGVEDEAFQVVLSGKKGLHVLIDQRAVTGSASLIPALPSLYRKIAERFYVEGMDFQVYSARRGNTFRIVNLKREGLEAFPVHVTLEELEALTVIQYREFISGPRAVPDRPAKIKKNDELYSIYQWAKKQVGADEKRAAERIPMRPAALETLKSFEPPCIGLLRQGRRAAAATFNQVGAQLGAYARVAGLDRHQRRSLAYMVADNTKSDGGKSQAERRQIVLGTIESVVNRPTFVWSCGAMRKVLDKLPCDECAVKEHWDDDRVESAAAVTAIIEANGQYFMREGGDEEEKLRRLTNFTLDPVHVVVEQPSDPSLPERRILTRCQVTTPAGRYGMIDVEDMAFTSKGAFTKQLIGHGNLAYFGTDNNVQTLKEYMFNEEKMSDTAKVIQVSQAGLHVSKLPGTDTYLKVYVEPGFSIDSRGTSGSHSLFKPQGSLPAFRDIKPLLTDARGKLLDDIERTQVEETIVSLLNLADKRVMAQLVGWMVATHLKQHIAAVTHQFPTLMFWGPAGSGKTTTMKIVAGLSGLADQEGMLASANTTKSGFAVRTLMCTSTTVPRIFDEFDPSVIDPPLMSKILQMIKLSWDATTWTQGGLDKMDGGTKVEQAGLTAPCVFMGEQDIRGVPEAAAVQHRAVQVYFTRKMRGSTDHAARDMMRRRAWLVKISYELMRTALWQDPDEVFSWRDSFIDRTPISLPDRPRLAYATVFMGLSFLLSTLKRMQVGEEAIAAVEQTMLALDRHLLESRDELVADKTQTQVSLMLSDISAYMTVLRFKDEILNAPAAQLEADTLYISPPALHTMYRAHARSIGAPVIIPNLTTFITLLKEESYVISSEHKHPNTLRGQTCFALDRQRLEDIGVSTSNFSRTR